MSTIIEIVNDALMELGESPISEEMFENATNRGARVMASRYARAKSQVLYSYFWKNADKVVKVSPVTITEAAADLKYNITLAGANSYLGATANLYWASAGVYYEAPIYRYNRSFDMPSDLVRVKLVVDINGRLESYDYSGGQVQADSEAIYVLYTANIPESLIDEKLAYAISLKLALLSATFLGASDKLDNLEVKYNREWRLAKSFDAQQDSARGLHSVDWLEERLGGHDESPYPGLI
jgi:hypothetical protein